MRGEGLGRTPEGDPIEDFTKAIREQGKSVSAARATQCKVDTEMRQVEAAKRALAIYEKAAPATEHPYLTLKGVPSSGLLRVGCWDWIDDETGEGKIISENALLVPMRDSARRIHSLQAIFDDGEGGFRKQYLKGGRKEGMFCGIGAPRHDIILMCEGLATALSLWHCTGHAVAVAFDAGNLIYAAKETRRARPNATLVLCADNDAWTKTPIDNPGVHYARCAALSVGGIVVQPEFRQTETRPTDFNDLHQAEGEAAVRDCITGALASTLETVEVSIAEDMRHSSDSPSLITSAAELQKQAGPASDGCSPIARAGQEVAAEVDDGGDSSDIPVPAVAIEDFLAYLPAHRYIFTKTGDLWPSASVNGAIASIPGSDGRLIKASAWLDENQSVQQMTWAPGEPALIRDRLVFNGDWVKAEGCACFNLYAPPSLVKGSADSAGPWLEHVRRVFSDETGHIVKWLAHRVQKPGEKINHALVLGGAQGIGKDTILEPVRHAVGPCNFSEVSPVQLQGRFNPFIKSVILRVSEARDLGEYDRYAFYEHMKPYTAAPPNALLCDEKNLPEHYVRNVCGVILTTNHQCNGIYLPPDDRRHFVAWSSITNDQFPPDYFRDIYAWLNAGGIGHVAAYLRTVDLSDFDPKAPPPKTPAFWAIVDASRSPEEGELADALEMLGHPLALTLNALGGSLLIDSEFRAWLQDRKNRRQIPHRLELAGYTQVRNDAAKDRLWKVAGRRQTIYALKTICERDRIEAATKLCSMEGYCGQSCQ